MPKDDFADGLHEVQAVSVDQANAMLSLTKLQMMEIEPAFGFADCDGGRRICMWLPWPDLELDMTSESTAHKLAMKAALKSGQMAWSASVKTMIKLREKETGVRPLHLCVYFTEKGPRLIFAKGPEPKSHKHSHGGPGHKIKVDPKLKAPAKPGKAAQKVTVKVPKEPKKPAHPHG